MKEDDLNDYMPSILNPRVYKKENKDISLTQNSIASRCSLSLRRKNCISKWKQKVCEIPIKNKENSLNVQNHPPHQSNVTKNVIDLGIAAEYCANNRKEQDEDGSIGYSAIQDLNTIGKSHSSPLSFGNVIPFTTIIHQRDNRSVRSVSSNTDLVECVSDKKSENTVIYEVQKPVVKVSFGVQSCKNVEVSTRNSNIKRVLVSHRDKETNVDCEIVESSELSIGSDLEENMNEAFSHNSQRTRKLEVSVNFEIKRKKLSDDTDDNSKVLILNTDAIEKISHVIVQPPNYKLVKRKFASKKISSRVKKKIVESPDKNGRSDSLKQKRIESYFFKPDSQLSSGIIRKLDVAGGAITARDDAQVMSKTLSIADAANTGVGKLRPKRDNESPKSNRIRREGESPKRNDVKTSNSDAPRGSSPRSRNDSISSYSPRKTAESLQFNLSSKAKIAKSTVSSKTIPHHKIVAGTHFAVDAFSYGDIPNVKYYFLTHFHSDHYSGLKKGFNKWLFCSQVTADLCISRLGVNSKCIHVINLNETIKVEGVDVTAVDANHCPGAIMLVFTLPNGKTLLHCGDFRACPMMESYPIFWNKDIHTIYLDTTYCNPRYDFPTQEQSLEMALYLLRQKKFALEKVGKKFSSVLIVCGTYTIGKEKFFLGMARRVGCTVWAFPEKDRVLQLVEGRSFSHAPPQSCQLHVLAMRDLTYEKLKTYLESLQGAFTEVVAFKPSGWENEKNSTVEKDVVTIHGIPYSEHSSFSEMIRFVKFLKPKQVVPTVDISGGIKAVQKYFPCPLLYKEDVQSQSKLTDYFSIHNKQQVPAVT
ncbi:uncharacterized protein Snm1 [Plodia interpunctella]|uniref:uncharacterized protein Snm1 n=1 Tax=Plodia interpunctella TaxID=58824 RepID=UPI0023678E11|nr:uncharacterized protein LOC128679197 [Plodia interpunctella]XP_053617241.1 uncharacterized protein LOC128679197 [Plodia interpunctella]